MERKKFTMEPLFEKRFLIEEAMRLLRQSLEGQTERALEASPCERYGAADYGRYIDATMGSERENDFEAHCVNCLACARGLVAAWKMRQAKVEAEEDARLLAKATAIMDRLDAETSREPFWEKAVRNVLDIVVRLKDGVVDLVETTGQSLEPYAAGAVRGDAGLPRQENRVHILQKFESPPLSVDLAISKFEDKRDDIKLTLSIMNSETEKFVSGLIVRLEDRDKTTEEVTNEDGCAEFIIKQSGRYKAEVFRNEAPLLKLQICFIT